MPTVPFPRPSQALIAVLSLVAVGFVVVWSTGGGPSRVYSRVVRFP